MPCTVIDSYIFWEQHCPSTWDTSVRTHLQYCILNGKKPYDSSLRPDL